MEKENAERLLSEAIDLVRRAGADKADAVLDYSVSQSASFRMGALEDVERSESFEIGLRAIYGQRAASVSTTDVNPKGLPMLAERCAAMAKSAPEDPYVGLADKSRLSAAPFPDLELGDFADPNTDVLKERAAACEQAALDVQGVVNSSGAGASYGEGRQWLMTSDGFFGESSSASHSIGVSVIAQDDAGMERDYDTESKTHFDDLRTAQDIGRLAGLRAVARLSPRKLKSRPAPVMFDKRLSASLLGHLASAANGSGIARGVSFLKEKRGERIFPESVNIIDDPFRKRGHGSIHFDGEGVKPDAFNLIDKGVLTQWIKNSAIARQLGEETNGRATRNGAGAPGTGTTNLYMEAGAASVEQLLADAGEALIVTDMFGPQVNPNTGDYSVGCSGFWSEKGEILHPVSEITIAGNLLEMYADISPANDLEFTGAKNAPSLLIREMTIAGD